MFSGKMHLLVDLLDACHVGLRIIRKLNFISAAHTLGSPVEISEIYRASHFAGNGMESCLPTLYRLAGAFRSIVVAFFLSTGMPPSFLSSQPRGPLKNSPFIMQ